MMAKIVIGQDGYLYAVIGDLNHDGQLQNFPDGPPPDDTGSIFRINPEDGSAALTIHLQVVKVMS